MRAFCTVSAPLEVCASSADQLSPGSRFLALRLLGNQQPKTLYFLVDAKSRVREVYTQTCLHFATQGMLDTELFGLAVLIDGDYMFADPESKLSKYGPKSWRSSHTHGLDANGRPLLELHFRVQFYVESPFMLKDETSRHYYYLQLKYNALQRDIPKENSEQAMILLGGLALQADFGDAPASAAKEAAKQERLSTGEESAESAEATTSAGCTTTTSTATVTTKTTTTTLPKISKSTNNANERILRLSAYMASTSKSALSTTMMTTTTTVATTLCHLGSKTTNNSLPSVSQSSVLPISGSLKRSLEAVAATLTPSSSSSSISCGAVSKSVSKSASSASSATTASAATSTSMASNLQADYFRLDDYLSVDLRSAWAVSALRACHRENRGMTRSDAELHYIQQASVVHESINAHTYRMRLSKNENGLGNSVFVVYAKGIKIFNLQDDSVQQQITFLWPNITKLSFERKKFEIRSGDSKITLYATADEKNKMLLTLCRETHQFSMKMAARLKEVSKREEEESNCLHSCYMYSRSLHLPYKSKNDQRISVISSTSSNTTSGIVSDRVHSEDELEIMINSPPAPIAAPSTESLALAHLLDRDRPHSVSRQTSSVGQVSLKDLEEQLAALSVRQAQKQHRASNSGDESPTDLSHASGGNSSTSGSLPTSSQRTADSSLATDSPNSQHNIGSQCSSTCSTVVVTSSTETGVNALASLAVNASMNVVIPQRRNSTSSSLELGFSHTAQNSTLSETESTCIEHDFNPSSTQDELESFSGVYTLAHGAPPTETSGVYTMHSSEITGQSSEIAESEKSSHYGIFQPAKNEISDDHLSKEHTTRDSVDGGNYHHGKRIKNEEFRLRSDSNVSTSGSFRGDGSDPTDNKHSLLSAEELTDLIVGRGTYPSRKTVSSTMDSDCDYVTLPPPMEGESYIQGHQDTAPTEDHAEDLLNDLLPTDPPAPPQRIDSNALSHTNLTGMSNIRMRSPPPYHARHEKTGLCGPPVHTAILPKTSTITTPPSLLAAVPSTNVPLMAATRETKPALNATASLPPPPPPPPPQVATRRREPPPYPSSHKQRPTSLVSMASIASSSLNHSNNVLSTASGSLSSLKSEEVTARFITTRPQINILKAHTSMVNENPKPSYASPNNCSSAASSVGSVSSVGHHLAGPLSQHSVHNSNYVSGSQASLSFSRHAGVSASPAHISAAVLTHAQAAAAGATVIPSTIGVPIVPYGLHGPHKSMSSLHQQPPPPPPPYTEIKPSTRTCVLLPVIKPRQYLPPPPPSLPRQPPPPPPPQLAGVYNSSLARKQIELYQQQLCSDVDYVIYPIQDPAVSQQEYLDAKQVSILATMAQTPPPHPYYAYHTAGHGHAGGWDTCKGHAIYRSTPYLPLALSTHSRYASTQNLSDTYVQLPSAYSPLYSPSMASLCSSYEAPPPPPLHPAALATSAAAAAAAAAASTSSLFARSRSDDNILNTIDSQPKMKRSPPPPPPPYVNRRLKKPPMPTPTEKPPPIPSKPSSSLSNVSLVSASLATCHYQLPPRKPPTLSSNRGSSQMTMTSSGAQWAGERPRRDYSASRGSNSILARLQASAAAANRQAGTSAVMKLSSGGCIGHSSQSAAANLQATATTAANALDIALLREKSKHLDLPLISALCNDRSLLKQTKVLVNPKHSRNFSNANNSSNNNNSGSSATSLSATTSTTTSIANISSTSTTSASATTTLTTIATNNNTMSKSQVNATSSIANASGGGNNSATSNANSNAGSKNTHSSIATTTTASSVNTLTKARKTATISHRHPNDKLPPLPMQLAEANNYVMDPAILKHHKSYNP